MTGSEKPSSIEGIKVGSEGLREPIPKDLGLQRPDFREESVHLLKHHGVYQQIDRDSRAERKRAGLDPDYRFMVRVKLPGGRMTADQYLVCDALATEYGDGDLRVTSRQGLQIHGVLKAGLRPLIHDLNVLARVTTCGAAGDVARNVAASPVADIDPAFSHCSEDLLGLAAAISAHFAPRTSSYVDLWLDDGQVEVREDGSIGFVGASQRSGEPEPIYGKAYLPRKFKIALATDFDNSVDAFANDVGLIAAVDGDGALGYEVVVGGGLGFSKSDPDTFARIATPLAFVSPDRVMPLLDAVVGVFRDNGNRSDRSRARLKYLIEDWGMDRFRAEVEKRLGLVLEPPRGVVPDAQPLYLGWSRQVQAGLNYVGLWTESGRIVDVAGGAEYKTAIRAVVDRFAPEIRFTPQHNVILSNIRDDDVSAVAAMLAAYGIPADEDVAAVRRGEMACPSFPYCGRATAEAERLMPELMGELARAGHADADVVIRVSGCTNNCSRPRTAELGVLGSYRDGYMVFTGGNRAGTRLNKLLLPEVGKRELCAVLGALLDLWKSRRQDGEPFGDWSNRVGITDLRRQVVPVLGDELDESR